MSPEERAVEGFAEAPDDGKTKTLDSDEAGTAALAQGLASPPLEDPNKL
jgi:hypothetical protein